MYYYTYTCSHMCLHTLCTRNAMRSRAVCESACVCGCVCMCMRVWVCACVRVCSTAQALLLSCPVNTRVCQAVLMVCIPVHMYVHVYTSIYWHEHATLIKYTLVVYIYTICLHIDSMFGGAPPNHWLSLSTHERVKGMCIHKHTHIYMCTYI